MLLLIVVILVVLDGCDDKSASSWAGSAQLGMTAPHGPSAQTCGTGLLAEARITDWDSWECSIADITEGRAQLWPHPSSH